MASSNTDVQLIPSFVPKVLAVNRAPTGFTAESEAVARNSAYDLVDSQGIDSQLLLAPAYRTLLWTHFCRLYFPKDDMQYPGLAYSLKLGESSAAGQAILDSVALFAAGSQKSDPRLVAAAGRSRNCAVIALRRAISTSNFAIESLACFTHILDISGRFSSGVGMLQVEAAVSHSRGMAAALYHAAIHGATPAVRSFISSHFRQFEFWNALECRTAMNTQYYDMIWTTKQPATAFSCYTDFNSIVAHVPGLLERSDAIMRDEEKGDLAASHLLEIDSLVERLNDWMLKEYAQSPLSCYDDAEPTMLEEARVHRQDTKDSALRLGYNFSTVAIGSVHLCYWTALLELKRAWLGLLHLARTVANPHRTAFLMQSASDNADKLLRACCGLLRADCGILGTILAMSALRRAHQWFLLREDLVKVSFCGRLQDIISGRGFACVLGNRRSETTSI